MSHPIFLTEAEKNALLPETKLRVALNFGNAVLVQESESHAEPRGVTPAIARELCHRLGVELEFLVYQSAGEVVSAGAKDQWDLAFLAIDPSRAETLSYTSPYVVIEGSYLVRNDSPLLSNEHVDQENIRVAVGKNAAYDLFLSRELKNARIERAATTPAAVDLFIDQNLEVAAGVRGPLCRFVEDNPGFRVLPGSFMAIQQALALPAHRDHFLPKLCKFIEELKQQGFIQRELTLSQQFDARVAQSHVVGD